jgi:hypothetical protein
VEAAHLRVVERTNPSNARPVADETLALSDDPIATLAHVVLEPDFCVSRISRHTDRTQGAVEIDELR